ncbi:type IV pilin protein [Variovorax sp. UMC13]|uniref:type IV pilin protein n=1 Tax=Variovorax sp. UMC13 TaxID=1862326 RepID=UPI00287B97BF|nr:type IV pilin protein [Variovorax sp. UMC13]
MDQTALMRSPYESSKMKKNSGIPGFSKRSQIRGFTLIEMMIVVSVIGILSVIAIPSYRNYIQKARRVDAKNALLDMAARQERYFSINNSYSGDPAALGYAVTSWPQSVNSSGASYYSLRADATAATSTALPSFIAKATPVGSQTSDSACYEFRLNQMGVQTNFNSAGTEIAATSNCW